MQENEVTGTEEIVETGTVTGSEDTDILETEDEEESAPEGEPIPV